MSCGWLLIWRVRFFAKKVEIEDYIATIEECTPIWYVRYSTGEIKKGMINSVDANSIWEKEFLVRYESDGVADVFCARHIGDCLFPSEEIARAALGNKIGMSE